MNTDGDIETRLWLEQTPFPGPWTYAHAGHCPPYRVEEHPLLVWQIEGAEYLVVPHLIATRAVALIDEFFMETHTPAGMVVIQVVTIGAEGTNTLDLPATAR